METHSGDSTHNAGHSGDSTHHTGHSRDSTHHTGHSRDSTPHTGHSRDLTHHTGRRHCFTYIADCGNNRIQVLDTSGQFIRQFGHEGGEGRLERPTAVHIIGQFVYVSDSGRIAVYGTSGKFVTSFGKYGKGEGEFKSPHCITSDHNGFIYVCDWHNDRIKIL